MKKHYVWLILILCFCSIFSYGQTSKNFWFVAPDLTSAHNKYGFEYPNCEGGNPAFLNISAMSLATKVTISQPANPGFIPIILNLTANETRKIDLSYGTLAKPCNTQYNAGLGFNTIENYPYDQINDYGIYIESEQLITAYYQVVRTNNPDIWALKGENALGKEFWVPTQTKYDNHPTWFNPDPWNEIHIVATEDNTTVTIIPSQDLQKNGGGVLSAGVPIVVILNKGQTYGLRANSQLAAGHLSGSYITSTKNIAVTQSDDSQKGPGGCADVNGDQIVPVSIVGTEYIAMKGQLNWGEYVYILATVDGTSIYTNGNAVAIATINKGVTYALLLGQPNTFIRTSEPAYMYHEAGFGCEVGGALLPSIFCTGSVEVYFTRSSVQDFFLNLMVPQGGEGNFWIEYDNGSTFHIDPTWFEPVVGTGTVQTPKTWMALKAFVNNPNKEFNALIPVNEVVKVYNTSDYFHLGIINGGSNTGCNYGYFSDFGSIEAGAEVATNGGDYIKACYGDSVQLIAQGGLTYNWALASGGMTYLTDNTLPNPFATPPSGTYDYDVHITGDCNLDTSIRITVKMGDYLNADFHVTDPILCYPDSVQIVNNSIGTNLNYQWDFGDSKTSTTGSTNFYHGYDSLNYDSVYRIYLLLKDDLDCIDTLRKNVIIYPAINADFTVNPIMGCQPLTATFSNISTGNLNTYHWEFGDLSSSSDSLPLPHKYTNYANTTTLFDIRLIATSPFLCTDTVTKTITTYPFIKSDFVMDKNVFCSPDSIQIVNGSSGGIDTIYWNFGITGTPNPLSNPSSDSLFNIIFSNSSGSTIQDSISLTVSNSMNCTDMLSRNIIVFPGIITGFTSDTVAGCSPLTISFTDTSNNIAVNSDHYNWNFGDGGSSSIHSPTHTFINSGKTDSVYMVVLLTTSDDNCVNSDTTYITVHPYLKANFTVNNADSCADYTVTITNISLGDTEQYQWDFGDSSPTSNTSINTFSHKYTNDSSTTIQNNLSLIISNTEGCVDTFTRVITVYPGMHTDIFSDLSSGCNPLTVSFTDSKYTNANVSNSIWDFGDGISYNGQTTNHNFTNLTSKDTTYIVSREITSTEGCVDKDTIDITVYAYVKANFGIDTSSGCTPLEVTHTFAGSGNVNSILWDFGGLATNNTDFTPVYTYPNDSSSVGNKDYTIHLTVENNQGCSDDVEKHVIVYPRPTASFNLYGIPPNSCQPLLLQFNNLSDDVANSYYWDFGDTTSVTRSIKTTENHFFKNLTNSILAYPVSLIATSSYYCKDTIKHSYTVNPYIKGDFTISKGASHCSPDTAEFINASKGDFNNAKWVFGDGTTESTPNNTVPHIYPVNITGQVIVYKPYMIAYNTQGCADTSQVRSITVYPEVKADFDLISNVGCHPFTPSFINNSKTTTSPVEYYYWELGYAGQTFSQEIPIIEYKNDSREKDTTYTISLTVQSSHYCEDNTSKDIIVYYKPYSSINVNEGTSCSPYQPVLSNNSVTGTGSNYAIEYGDGQSKPFTTTSIPTHTYRNISSDIDNYNIILTVTTSNNCLDKDTTKITVYPEVIASFLPDRISGCNKLSVIMDATGSINAQYYNWDFDDGESATLIKPTHQFKNYNTSDKTFDVKLTARSFFDCDDDTIVSITVYPQPKADFDVGPLTRQQFPDTTFNYTNNSNPGDWLFEWSFENGDAFSNISDKTFTHSYSEWRGGTYDITLKVTNKNNSQCSDTANHTVFVDPPKPVINFTIDIDKGCVPHKVILTDESLYRDIEENKWIFGDGESEQGSIQRTHTYDTAGEFIIELEISGPGGVERIWKPLTVWPLPEAKFQVTPKTVKLPNATIYIRNFSVNGVSYDWDFDDGVTSMEFEPSHTYYQEKPNNEDYRITMIATSENGCVDSATSSTELYRITVTGKGSIDPPNAFSPNADGLNDLFIPKYEMIREFHIQIYNRWGEKVYDAEGKNSDNTGLGWDGYIYRNGKNTGEEAPQGVYVYKLKGKYENGEEFFESSDITLIK